MTPAGMLIAVTILIRVLTVVAFGLTVLTWFS